MSSHSYLIVGCGPFEGRAAEKLLRKVPHPKIIAVDKNEERIKNISHLPIRSVFP